MSKEPIYISSAFSQTSAQAIADTLSNFKVIKTDDFNSVQDEQARAFIIRSKNPVGSLMLEHCKNLKAVISATSGFDHFEVEQVKIKKEIFFGYTPDANASSAAELTVFHALNFLRKGPSLLKNNDRAFKLLGNELKGKTVLIIGLGRIGKKVASIFNALGCNLLVHDPYLSSSVIETFNAKSVNFEEGLSLAEIVTLHCPLTPKTKHLLNEKTFMLIKNPEAFVINCARGGLINEEHLVSAIENKKLSGACLDVFESEPLSENSTLLNHESIHCTPHAGAFTEEAHKESALAAAKQVKFILENKTYIESLNYKASPLTPLPIELEWFIKSSLHAY